MSLMYVIQCNLFITYKAGLVLVCSDAQNVQWWTKMCSDERLFVQWWIKKKQMAYLLLREHKARRRNVKNNMGVCIEGGEGGVTIENVKKADDKKGHQNVFEIKWKINLGVKS